MKKVVIITGASDGIGKALTIKLSKENYKLVIIGRNREKTKAVAKLTNADYYVCDFTHLTKVRELGETLKVNYPTIDILVNNAGGMFSKKVITEDCFEKTMQVNHLAHFLLTGILIENLKNSNAIVINTASDANKSLSKLNINDLNLSKGYTYTKAYGNAKLANILFTREFNNRYKQAGVSTVCFHPGNVVTNFGNESIWMKLAKRFKLSRIVMEMVSPELGCDTAYYLLSTKPDIDWVPGEYYYKRQTYKAHKDGYNDQYAKSLWEQSCKMLNIDY